MDEQVFPIEDTPVENTEVTPTNFENEYRILDENNIEIFNPNLELGHLEKEELITYHAGSPEVGHYYVNYIELETGESFFLKENDPRIEITNSITGAFKYLPSEEDSSVRVKSASVRYIVDQQKIEPWEEKETILRYILYTEEELANRTFLNQGPDRLNTVESDTNDLLQVVADLAGSDIEERVQTAQETIDDLLLVIADIVGGTEA